MYNKMEHHHNHIRIDNDPDKIDVSKMGKKLKKNPWIISTVVLAVIAAILLILTFGSGMPTGYHVMKGDEAGSKLVEFLNGRTGGGVAYKSFEDLGSIYQVTVEYENQEIPVFVTKDGSYFVQGAVPIDEEAATDTPTDTGTTTPTPEVIKSDKPVVELFVMSHCPYGTQAEKGIVPVLELLGDKIDGSIKFVNYAMHGEKEVYEELNQYCIETEQNDKYYDYLTCFLGKTGTEADREACLTEANIDKTKLEKCTESADKEFDITKNFEDKSTWSSGQFPPIMFYDALNKEYGVRGSPTLVINGEQVSTGRDSASFLNAICNAFNEPPEECQQEVSSTSPSPGFGYAAGSAASATAQCG